MSKSKNTDNTELGEILHLLLTEHKVPNDITWTFEERRAFKSAKRQINALISKARIDELESLRVLVNQEGAGKIYIGGLADGTAVTVEERIKDLKGKL